VKKMLATSVGRCHHAKGAMPRRARTPRTASTVPRTAENVIQTPAAKLVVLFLILEHFTNWLYYICIRF
jgi:hypothetical protein